MRNNEEEVKRREDGDVSRWQRFVGVSQSRFVPRLTTPSGRSRNRAKHRTSGVKRVLYRTRPTQKADQHKKNQWKCRRTDHQQDSWADCGAERRPRIERLALDPGIFDDTIARMSVDGCDRSEFFVCMSHGHLEIRTTDV